MQHAANIVNIFVARSYFTPLDSGKRCSQPKPYSEAVGLPDEVVGHARRAASPVA